MEFKQLSQKREELNSLFIDNSAIGLKIKDLCKADGISIPELSEILGFTSVQPIYNWLEGKSKPRLDHIIKISFYFKVDVNELLKYSFEKNNSYGARQDFELY